MPAVTYPLDITGIAPTNLIVDELHTLTEINSSTYRIIIPEFSPFYLDNFLIEHVDNIGNVRQLYESVDFNFCLPYIGATRSIGKMIYGGLSIITEPTNGTIRIRYQTLGGEWNADPTYVLEVIAEHIFNPRVTVWDVVTNKPTMFPPINHDQSLDYVFGHQELIDALNALAEQIATGSNPTPTVIHLTRVDNPHEVTKAQVGLGNVANLSLATEVEVTNQTPVDKYLTLRQVLNIIATSAPESVLDHLIDYNNPHQTTKAQVGLGNVDNTADINKPISTATATALATKEATLPIGSITQYFRGDKTLGDFFGEIRTTCKATILTGLSTATNSIISAADTVLSAFGKLQAQITGHVIDTNNPHSVNKSQVGLGNVDNTADINKTVYAATRLSTPRLINGIPFSGASDIIINAVDSTDRIPTSEKAQPNGVATLDGSGLVPSSQLPSFVDDVMEYNNVASFPITGESSKIYVARDTNKTYRWSGSSYIYITSGAVDSVAGKTGVVTLVKSDVGLGNVDNTADIDKPLSNAAIAELATKENNLAIGTSLEYFRGDKTLGDFFGEIRTTCRATILQGLSTATNVVISATDTVLVAFGKLQAQITGHASNTSNPHSVTKAQVGLGNADNTADIDKPLSSATVTALATKEPNIIAGATTQYWRGDKTWADTSAAVRAVILTGLTTATNAVITASDTVLAAFGKLQAQITGHTSNTSNPHSVTKTQVGLSNVDNTADANKIVLSASKLTTARTINGVSFDGTGNIVISATDSTARIPTSEKGQPNGVATLDANGLVPSTQLPSYVDDVIEAATSVNFPVTGEVGKIYVALDTNKTYRWSGSSYIYITSGAVDSVAGKTGVVTLVKSDVGLGNVDNTSDANKPISTATATALSGKEATIAAGTTSQFWRGDKTWSDFATTARAVVLTGLTTATNAVITASDTILVAFGKLQAQITGHTGNTSNPHSVTKAQVGLSNVDNTSDVDKPLSTATTTALSGKEATITAGTIGQYWRGNKTWADLNTTVFNLALTGLSTATNAVITASDSVLAAFGKLQAQITNHISNTSNPHSVTKAQVGLSDVTNLPLATDLEVQNKELLDKYITLKQVVNITGDKISRAELYYLSGGR